MLPLVRGSNPTAPDPQLLGSERSLTVLGHIGTWALEVVRFGARCKQRAG